MKIMMFSRGMPITHASAASPPRAERVRQSVSKAPSALDFGSYVPAEALAAKVRARRRG